MSTEIVPVDDDLELSHLSPAICAELAAGLADVDGIKDKYSISDAQWDRLRNNKAFRAMMRESLQQFAGDMNAGSRITVKSQIALEEAIPILDQLIHDRDGSSQSKIDSTKMLAVLAKRTGREGDEAAAPGSGFAVNIHINAGENQPVIIDGEKVET